MFIFVAYKLERVYNLDKTSNVFGSSFITKVPSNPKIHIDYLIHSYLQFLLQNGSPYCF